MGMSEMLDIPWFRKEGGCLLTGFDLHARGRLRTRRKEYHMTLRYTQMI
jgi:hypothetical protein